MSNDSHPIDIAFRLRERARRRRRRHLPAGVRFLLAAAYLSIIAFIMALVHRFLARP
jgi:hypothetical protein